MSVIYFGTFLSIVTSNISSALFFPSASGIEIIPQKIFHSVQMYCFFLIIFIFKFQFGSIFKLIESFFNHAESTDEPIKGNLHLHCSIFVVQGFFFFFNAIFSECLVSLVDSSLLSAYIIHLVVYFSILYYIKHSYFKFLIQ